MSFTMPTAGTMVIKEAFGKFQVLLGGDIYAGEPMAFDASNNYGVQADANNSLPCSAVALQDGVSGDTIWAAFGAVISVSPTISGASYTATALAASTDFGSALYLSDTAGDYSTSASASIAQQVGWITGAYEMVIVAMSYLTGENGSFSGTLAVTGNTTLGGTLAVTGNTTVGGTLGVTGATTCAALTASGAVTANAGIVIGSAKGLIVTEKNYTENGAIATAGFVTLSANSADLAMTLAAPTAGSLLVIYDKANSGTKNHVVSAKAASGLFDTTNNTLTFNATGEAIVLFAVTTTQWIIVENIGTVGTSST